MPATPPSKTMSQSLTVKSAITTVVLYFAARYGWSPELAEAIAVVGAAVVAVGLRRGIGLSLVLVVFLGCCGPDLRPTLAAADKALERAAAEMPLTDDSESYNKLLKGRVAAVNAAREMITEALRGSQ